MRELTVGTLLCVLAMVATRVARADGIGPSYGYSLARAYDGSSSVEDARATSSSPWDMTTSASSGSNTAETDTAVWLAGIRLSAEWSTDGASGSFGLSSAYINFTADGASGYSLSGAYEFGGGTGTGYYDVILRDLTAGTYTFINTQYSVSVAGEDYTLGGSEGTHYSARSGDLSGTLVNGHSYQFSMYASLSDYLAATNPLSGSAWATLSIGSAVPEPGSLALFGLGAAGLALRRRRRATP